MRWFAALAAFFFVVAMRAETPCACDPSVPESMNARQCSLCKVAEQQPKDVTIFFVADANPRKPNRTLALPREHTSGLNRIADLKPETQRELWTKTIEMAKSKWGEKWGIAYNGDNVRTQCHVHIHIGRLIEGVEAGDFKVVDSVDQIPAPGADGYWIHPVNGKLHIHTGEQITETVLLR